MHGGDIITVSTTFVWVLKGATTLSTITLSFTSFSIATLRKTILSIMALGIESLIDHNDS
jgi:hypothetical protein